MDNITNEQIRQFRLHTHHLDTWYPKADMETIVGACGFQNSPPGVWEVALHNRILDYQKEDMRQMLEVEKSLLQAWSFRGAPVVFPTSESDTFLSALVSRSDEPWIYTKGIQVALDFLQMSFEELFLILKQVMPKLEDEVLKSKTTLDQTLAEWMLPLLPNDKRDLWIKPSFYGNKEKQTIGGAAVSFLLRPCAYMGLVVFGKREGISPTFTAYKNWISHSLEVEGMPQQKLVRKYLHCYGPASINGFKDWIGCSTAQADRIWETVTDEIEPVNLSGRDRYILSEDKKLLMSAPQWERELHLLGGHDPYLGLQDRDLILDHKLRQKQIWQFVSNPSTVLWHGEIVGIWKSKKKGRGLDIEVTLWVDGGIFKNDLKKLVEGYALFQQLKVNKITFLT